MDNKKAFLTVEVLISIVIIFMAIVTMTSSIKSVALFERKSTQYEITYITLKSVLNYVQKLELNFDTLTTRYTKIDTSLNNLNNFIITLEVKKKNEDYLKDIDSFGNISKSNKKIILLQMRITLKNKNIRKVYDIYMTKMIKE